MVTLDIADQKYIVVTISGQHFNHYLSVIKQIPSAKYIPKNKIWQIHISDYVFMFSLFSEYNITDVTQTDQLEQAMHAYNKWRETLVELMYSNEASPLIDEQKYIVGELMPHQRVVAQYLVSRGRALNCLEMGCGKTLSTLLALKYLEIHKGITSCLIVVPASVKEVWKQEIDRFLPSLAYTVINGKSKDRMKQYVSQTFIKIVNYALLRKDFNNIYFPSKIDCCIVDEVHRIRNYKSMQSKVIKKIGARSTYRFGLSGTPLQNNLYDVYSVMQFIEPAIFCNYCAFDDRYVVRNYFGGIDKYKNVSEINDKLKLYMIRRTKKEVLSDLSDKIYMNRYVSLKPEQRTLYKQIKNRVTGPDNILANLTFLRECCCDVQLIEESVDSCSAKYEELLTFLSEIINDGRKIVIYSQYKRMIKILAARLYEDRRLHSILFHGGLDQKQRNEAIQSFTTSDISVFLMTAAGAEGINLQCADTIIFFDLPFNPQQIKQIEDRLHRKGQEKSVTVIRLIAENTVESRVLALLEKKEKLFDDVIIKNSSFFTPKKLYKLL